MLLEFIIYFLDASTGGRDNGSSTQQAQQPDDSNDQPDSDDDALGRVKPNPHNPDDRDRGPSRGSTSSDSGGDVNPSALGEAYRAAKGAEGPPEREHTAFPPPASEHGKRPPTPPAHSKRPQAAGGTSSSSAPPPPAQNPNSSSPQP